MYPASQQLVDSAGVNNSDLTYDNWTVSEDQGVLGKDWIHLNK